MLLYTTIYTTCCILLLSDKYSERTSENNEYGQNSKTNVGIANDFKQWNQKLTSGAYDLALTLKTKKVR